MIDKIYNAKRISLFGYPACGKSTLSEHLGNVLNIPVYSLDKIRWNNTSYDTKDENMFLEEYQKIINKEKWIIDGNALDWIDSRLEKSDILIFFDATVDQAISNYKKRSENIKKGIEKRINFDNEVYTSEEETIEWIKDRFTKKVFKLKNVLPNYVDKLIVINNYEELNNILAKLGKK